MRIGKKTIHSVIIGLAMALPVLYLGGSMIAGLAGAHGNFPFADETEQSKPLEVSFDEMTHYAYPNINVGWGNVGSSLRASLYFFETEESFTLNVENIPSDTVSQNCEYNFYVFDEVGAYVSKTNIRSALLNGAYQYNQGYTKFCFEVYIPNANLYPSYFEGIGLVFTGASFSTLAYGVDNGDYVFGNFFPKNNFVERIGQNALSENPKGFAPFGTMLSFLDVNMFHAGDSQTALMVYGMVYWSLHVVLADLVYHVLVFVPNLINRVFDWFGQKGVSDE